MSEPMKTRLRDRVRGILIKRYADTHGGFTDRSTDEFDLDAQLVISEIAAFLEEPTPEWLVAGAEAFERCCQGTKCDQVNAETVFLTVLRTALAGGG